jgi:hypothetical protein
MYEAVLNHYLDESKCFQLIVEDANDDMQVI